MNNDKPDMFDMTLRDWFAGQVNLGIVLRLESSNGELWPIRK